MDSLGSSLPWVGAMNQANDFDHKPSRPSGSYPASSANTTQRPIHRPSAQSIIQVCPDVKPRLTKEQHDMLECHFQQQQKPTTNTKKGFADALGVPLDKINNWFQNRRAKVKQDLKKQMNAYAMYRATLAQHSQQYLPPSQPLPSSVSQEFFGPNTVLPSTEYTSDPAPSDGASTPSNGFVSQVANYGAASSMLETSQSGSGEDMMIPNMQTNGYSLQESLMHASGPEQTLAFGQAPFSQDYDPHTYSIAPDFSGYGTSFSDMGGLSDSLAYPPYLHTSAPPALSDSQSITPLSSSASPNTMPSLTSAYSHPVWTDDRKDSMSIPGDSPQGSLDSTVAADTSIQWPSGLALENGLSESGFYQHPNPSAPVLSRHIKTEAEMQNFEPPHHPTEAFGRRNSSTAALTESINTIAISSSPGAAPDLLQTAPPSGLAARRGQKQRPANLGLAALRSVSSSGLPISPGALTAPEQSLRRIRSGGVGNGGRISKPLISAGQRSPMHLSFAEAAASPKFARHTSNNYSVSSPPVSSPTISATASSLAPPTPSTPGEFARFPPWQSHGVVKTYPSNNMNIGISMSWSGEALNNSLHVNVSSPPDTPLDADQMAQYRSHLQARNQALFRDTPPQSAPATQQSFGPSIMVPQSHHVIPSFSNSGEQTSHNRRPSLPDTNFAFDSYMPWPAVPMFNASGDLQMSNPMQFNMSNHQQNFEPPQLPQAMQQYNSNSSALQESIVKPDFSVHQYSPPHGTNSASPPRSDSVPKIYHFCSTGPQDYENATPKS